MKQLSMLVDDLYYVLDVVIQLGEVHIHCKKWRLKVFLSI